MINLMQCVIVMMDRLRTLMIATRMHVNVHFINIVYYSPDVCLARSGGRRGR